MPAIAPEKLNIIPLRNVRTWDAVLKPLGYEQVTGLSAVKTLTVPDTARAALIVAETQAVRWRDDGTNPTASVGMPLAVDTPYWYTGDLGAIKFIEAVASAKLNVSYYGAQA